MSAKEFFETVVKMREAQKKFFKSHSSFDLETAKRYEKVVDAEIKRVREITGEEPKQLTLF